MADIALDHKKRQAAYAAKNRRKAKAIRRPDARTIADAYLAAVEGGGLERMMRVYIGKLAPDCDVDARARDAVELVRQVAVLVLLDKGYDLAQVRDKFASMNGEEK
ncbi:hypothetical protein GGE43_002536 [Agrobacterium tumefaciens]|uniref:Uncharacterized protein n=1 Tax=Agrobacterium radiobacter TaxID=362 RepID=A0ABR6J914_AGRRD|nr:hypothetical protein [Agrobacterium radiobacter]TGE79030.1 hypothetical protein C9410_12840 [Rhizobium sp. SEMIA 439]MBB4282617.1 hypothetical protein [Agrobacterium radiobacter]MBB4318781.1 hypothetical protein [Agrobacterium radiobacter]MBB4324049.1 hypothetical protein [Agrobacterium radiobacter]MBB4336313.1 hypothetical protein [Agrobacterium radiobacter]